MDRQRLDDIAERHGIVLLVRFGSTVTGRAHQSSDVDLGVLLRRVPETFAAHADLVTDLQSLVEGREADVVVLNRADPLLLKQVTDNCELLHGSAARLDALKLYAFRRYQDHRRYLDMERSYVDRKIAAMRR